MTHSLAISLPYAPGEAPAAYVSRLALINGHNAKGFAEDQGLDLQSIIQGDPEVLRALAE